MHKAVRRQKGHAIGNVYAHLDQLPHGQQGTRIGCATAIAQQCLEVAPRRKLENDHQLLALCAHAVEPNHLNLFHKTHIETGCKTLTLGCHGLENLFMISASAINSFLSNTVASSASICQNQHEI